MIQALVVDSDPLSRKALLKLLMKKTICKSAAASGTGEDAVEYCRRNSPDIVFIEVKLAGMSGLEAAKQIRQIHPGTDICIISAYQSLKILKEALALDIKKYLRKPFYLPELQSAVSRQESMPPSDYGEIIRAIEQIVESNDYKRVHDDSAALSDRIMELSGGRNDKAGEILRSASTRILSLYLENPFSDGSLVERFSLDVNYLDDAFMIEMWLCNFMDYLFKRRFIERYEYVKDVFSFIDEHIKEDINIQLLVQHCRISQQYLLRLFKERMSMSTFDYIQYRKMILAKWYLSFDEYSALDAAMTLGFGSGGYFSKVFKKYEGMTPHQYKVSSRSRRKNPLWSQRTGQA